MPTKPEAKSMRTYQPTPELLVGSGDSWVERHESSQSFARMRDNILASTPSRLDCALRLEDRVRRKAAFVIALALIVGCGGDGGSDTAVSASSPDPAGGSPCGSPADAPPLAVAAPGVPATLVHSWHQLRPQAHQHRLHHRLAYAFLANSPSTGPAPGIAPCRTCTRRSPIGIGPNGMGCAAEGPVIRTRLNEPIQGSWKTWSAIHPSRGRTHALGLIDQNGHEATDRLAVVDRILNAFVGKLGDASPGLAVAVLFIAVAMEGARRKTLAPDTEVQSFQMALPADRHSPRRFQFS